MSATNPSPVQFDLAAPEELDRWRPFVQWLLAIPHFIVAGALSTVSRVLVFVSIFTVLFTEKIPDGIYNFQVMVLRYSSRVSAYAGFMHSTYPKFEFDMTAADPGGDPITLSIAPQAAKLKRWMPLVKWFLAIPHYIMVIIYGIGAVVLWIVNAFIILFTGKWNAGHRSYIVKVARYTQRVTAYVYLLRDEYPSFTLE
jgi:roadblock/LC7 domain-containing protein